MRWIAVSIGSAFCWLFFNLIIARTAYLTSGIIDLGPTTRGSWEKICVYILTKTAGELVGIVSVVPTAPGFTSWNGHLPTATAHVLWGINDLGSPTPGFRKWGGENFPIVAYVLWAIEGSEIAALSVFSPFPFVCSIPTAHVLLCAIVELGQATNGIIVWIVVNYVLAALLPCGVVYSIPTACGNLSLLSYGHAHICWTNLQLASRHRKRGNIIAEVALINEYSEPLHSLLSSSFSRNTAPHWVIGFRQNTDPRSTDPLTDPPYWPPLLTPYKINGKIKIKKAQNYQWDPIQVHQ